MKAALALQFRSPDQIQAINNAKYRTAILWPAENAVESTCATIARGSLT